MDYYKELFTESDLEKELKEKRKSLDKAFVSLPEYKAYIDSISEINHQIFTEQSKRWEFIHERYKGINREKKKIERIPKNNDFYIDTFDNDKINSLFDEVCSLSDSERKKFLKKVTNHFKYDELDVYEHPQTTIDDIKELQKILAQCVINFVGEKDLKDIDEVHFYFDGIQDSVAQCEWVPSSDSSISVIGWQKENETEFNERKLIGNYF